MTDKSKRKLKGLPSLIQIKDRATQQAFRDIIGMLQSEGEKNRKGKNSLFSSPEDFNQNLDRTFDKLNKQDEKVDDESGMSLEIKGDNNIEVADVSIGDNRKFVVKQIERDGESVGTALRTALITEATTTAHIASIYSNTDGDAESTTQVLRFIQIADGSVVPTGTYLPCWQQSWGSSGASSTFWTADIPRWFNDATSSTT